ncbi:unnamed protein product [Cochlearia groenlandica]
MAVEAHNLNPLLSTNREMMHHLETNSLLYNNKIRYGTVLSTTPTLINPNVGCQASPLNPLYNATPLESSVTFNSNGDFLLPTSSPSRKRFREESLNLVDHTPRQKPCTDPLMFLGQDLSCNVQNHNLDIDRLIYNHVEIMRKEIEEKRKTQEKKIIQAIELGLTKKLRAKDEEINNITKLNLFLEEKVKSLHVENQIWRDVAQSNEATVNALRSNLQQVLTAVEKNRWEEATVAHDDVESCCGSNEVVGDSGENTWRLVGEAQDKKRVRTLASTTKCRGCGKGEASVLLLPCRHVCLCSKCESLFNTCPICKSPKNATLNVNL